MKLVILPGNSSSNREWAEEARSSFATSFSDIYVQNYSHWDSGSEWIDFDAELEKLVANVSGDCIVMAKSAGAMLAIYGVYKNKFSPQKCVFLGLPTRLSLENNLHLDQWIKGYNVPTIVIQNSNDPVTSFEEVKTLLIRMNKTNIELVEIDGDTHAYDDFDLIKEKIGDYIVG